MLLGEPRSYELLRVVASQARNEDRTKPKPEAWAHRVLTSPAPQRNEYAELVNARLRVVPRFS